ncbi:hypothetical protein [Flavisolibacter ginsenosidimutans]|uniref:Uncharacterized protein n=1 Tax=Flavisolibacter ginsenosidimutans TaxID=661481 RepID=A0A5B8UJF5_9BACT|nr:hypothetical protein [Flavisolibacter ginsenosidimutans]QEC56683.1 hypothetical protein FSB75_12510 [Flavisolibacter ginsenosidimutans]
MNHFISLAEASEMTARYRQQRNAILQPSFQNLNLLAVCETFDRSGFDALLSKPACAFIRIYYGMDADMKIHAIIVAADENNQDILPTVALANEVDDDILDRANRCPDLCPPDSPLIG